MYLATTIHPRTDVDIVETTWDELHQHKSHGKNISQWIVPSYYY